MRENKVKINGLPLYIIKTKFCISPILKKLHIIKSREKYTLVRDDIRQGDDMQPAVDDIPSLRLG